MLGTPRVFPLLRIFSVRRLLVAGGLVAIFLAGGAYLIAESLREVAKPMGFSDIEALTLLSDPQLHAGLIRTGEADYHYNCHGWAFTHGQREVDAEEVEQFLQEEYQPTQKPQLGDVIVYRDHIGRPMHSGVVKAVGEDGLVLVESKWGASGRFIHQPNISRTFSSFGFYHKDPELAKGKQAKEQHAEAVDAMDDDD